MGKKEKEYRKKLKDAANRPKEMKHEKADEYLKRVMGKDATEKPLKPVDNIHLENNSRIITHGSRDY